MPEPLNYHTPEPDGSPKHKWAILIGGGFLWFLMLIAYAAFALRIWKNLTSP